MGIIFFNNRRKFFCNSVNISVKNINVYVIF